MVRRGSPVRVRKRALKKALLKGTICESQRRGLLAYRPSGKRFWKPRCAELPKCCDQRLSFRPASASPEILRTHNAASIVSTLGQTTLGWLDVSRRSGSDGQFERGNHDRAGHSALCPGPLWYRGSTYSSVRCCWHGRKQGPRPSETDPDGPVLVVEAASRAADTNQPRTCCALDPAILAVNQ
jgi:hypothetical protein